MCTQDGILRPIGNRPSDAFGRRVANPTQDAILPHIASAIPLLGRAPPAECQKDWDSLLIVVVVDFDGGPAARERRQFVAAQSTGFDGDLGIRSQRIELEMLRRS